jgi:Flp pilus assembly protein TadG
MHGEEGGALLEMAMTLPLLMLVLTGAASFALAFYNLQQLGNATSSAVQMFAGQPGAIIDPCDTVMTSVQASLPGWNMSNLSYTLTITNASGVATAYSTSSGSSGSSTSFTCEPAGAGGSVSTAQAPNEPVTLTVSYSNPWLPIFTWLPSWSFSAPKAISSTQAAMAL